MSKGIRAVVTGSTQGIGLAVAKRLAGDGYSIVLNYHQDESEAEKALRDIRRFDADARLICADVATENGAANLVEKAVSSGPVDVWVNTVGDFELRALEEMNGKDIDKIFASNFKSVFYCCKQLIPHMRNNGSGNIINIGMMHAEKFRAVPNTVAYTVAKHGVVILTKSLAKSEGQYGIRVNVVSPGFINTDSFAPEGVKGLIPMGRKGTEEEVAATVAFLASGEASYITGEVLNVHGGALL